MGTPVAAAPDYVSQPVNFYPIETQILSVSTVTAAGGFTNTYTDTIDCFIANTGTAFAYLVFSTVASPTAKNQAGGASGTQYLPVPAGTVMTIQRGATQYFAAITDSGTTTLHISCGRGA